jgi:energy-converting hydrogenase B subunit D
MTWVQAFAVVAIALGAPAVVLTRDPVRQTIVLGIYGLLFAVLFLTFQAPDVALSQIVISTVGLPLMILLAIAKIREHQREREQDSDE